jgi:hypothetical protein
MCKNEKWQKKKVKEKGRTRKDQGKLKREELIIFKEAKNGR